LCLTLLLAIPVAHGIEVPRLVCEAPVYDFGAIADTQTVSHTFILRNTGAAPVIVQRIFACCGLSANLSATNLPPGSNAVLTVTLNPAGMRGAVEKPVDLITNDPINRYCRALFRGSVTPTILVEPRYVNFDVQRGDVVAVAEVLVSPAPDSRLRVTDVAASAGFAASFVTDTGGVFRVRAQTVPPLTNGWNRGMLTVFTDHPAHRQFNVPISAHVAEEWNVYPAEILLSDASFKATNLTRWVVVSSRFGRGFEVGSVETPDGSGVVTVQQLRTNIVRLAVGGIRTGPEIDGKVLRVRLRTDPPTELSIPFRMAQ
jgi:hypothetical protein